MASLYIKDVEVNELAQRLADERKMTKTAAVKLALRAELDRTPEAKRPLRERMLEFWERHPLPPSLGPVPDKAFYDELSGNL